MKWLEEGGGVLPNLMEERRGEERNNRNVLYSDRKWNIYNDYV